MSWVMPTVLAMLMAAPTPVLASAGGHSGPTPTCRKGCKPLTPEQLRQLRPNQLPPQVGGRPPEVRQ